MKGDLFYAVADDFDARREFITLTARVAAQGRYRGYWSALKLLLDVARDGFNPIEMRELLERTEAENVLLFEDAGVRLTFDVPANGLLSTPDIMLLASEFCPRPGQAMHVATRVALIAASADRRIRGRRATWALAKT